MKFDEKLHKLRKEKGLSQEELAEMMNVSRQAVSRWESGLSYPETEKIITLSEIFGVTVDSMLKDGLVQYSGDREVYEPYWVRRGRHYEFKSKTILLGLPLVHVNIGWGFKKAKGIIAIGNIATGFLSIGLVAFGGLALGLAGLGLVSFGVLSLGLLFALGAVAIGGFALGAVSIGVISLGAVAIGQYAVGALAIAKDIAVGDHAYGHIAVGRVAEGARVFVDAASPHNQFLPNINKQEVIKVIHEEFPNIKQWVVNFVTAFLR